MWLLILFIAVPLIEIALFIQVGGLIGLLPTLAIVLITAIFGTFMIRTQGSNVLQDIQRSFQDLRDPSEPLAHGAMILFAGALLLTPGFFTDTIGVALLFPQVRATVFQFIKQRILTTKHTSTHINPTIIETDYSEVHPNQEPSKWKKD